MGTVIAIMRRHEARTANDSVGRSRRNRQHGLLGPSH